MDGVDPFDPFGVFSERRPPEPTTPAPEPTDSHGGAAEPVRLDEQTAEPVTAEPDAVLADIPAMPAQPATILDHALAWARRGFRVFPLAAGEKVPPKGLAWKAEATTDPAKIKAWWAFEPRYNYAVAAGEGLLILDVDAGKNGYAALLDLDIPETLTVKTPGGGEHRYYLGPDVANSVDRIAPGLDMRSAGGYVVGPGSYFADADGAKGYTGFYTVAQDVPPVVAPESLVLLAGTPKEREQGPAVSIDDPDDIVFAIHYLLKDAPIAIEGRGGNATTYAVAARVIEIGVSAELAVDLMAEHWNERCLPPWTREELLTLCQNAQNYAQSRQGSGGVAAAAADWQGAVVLQPGPAEISAPVTDAVVDAVCDEETLAALLAMSPLLGRPILAGQARPATPWLVKRVIPRTGVGVIYGPSTGGKSYLVMDLAAKLWQGLPWFGAKVPDRSATVIFAFEGADFAGYRLDALRHAAGGDQPAVMVIPAGRMTPAGLKSLGPQLRGVDQFFRKKFGLGVGLVVIDTVSAAGLAEKEDKADDVAPAVKAVQEFAGIVGAFGLLVHHPNKGGADMRGSGAWFNNTDTVLRLEVTEGHPVRTLVVEKVKDGPTRELGSFALESITLGSDEDSEPITACVVAPATKPSRQATGGTAHFEKFVGAFEEAAANRGASLGGEPIAPLTEVEDRFKEAVAPHYKASSGVRTAWMRCRKYAEEAGIIRPVRGERNTYSLTSAAYQAENANAAF
ncbi:hypothetical protein J2X48_000922 [Bosea sp. BE271]|uniref:bifunctional DNA primase/polymerase n=1 Tax=Bosea TaxID=85413 RepID=UPI0028645946|nr:MULTISPECIES: bifunctional DNA primase/polymerase [Bosea]MDR6827204.1 hypothetical protein [Bosea robiniae]MDR6893914.1 hypothetical protein [Bosea sp. BE109]MDR7137309.1 hypothetical protein [Bosea sp. BE168]MDR7174009.1 hypothetical protein [Bosea sp. BE271]